MVHIEVKTAIILSVPFFCLTAAKKGSIALAPGFSCNDIVISGDAQGDGEYWIDPTASGDPFTVFCDMATDQGKICHLNVKQNRENMMAMVTSRLLTEVRIGITDSESSNLNPFSL